ncbi:MAG: Rieske (2Fe-2S) protein [Oscillochloris sp.]|nr:Rieske (2Fe-2S) protein [Oscillochloris sp.]
MPHEWVYVLDLHDLRPGQMAYVDVEGLPVALANVDGAIYAFSDACRHEGGPLSSGVLIGETVTCPWHGWVYSVRTGKSIVPPVGLRIPTYPVHIESGRLSIAIDWSELS